MDRYLPTLCQAETSIDIALACGVWACKMLVHRSLIVRHQPSFGAKPPSSRLDDSALKYFK